MGKYIEGTTGNDNLKGTGGNDTINGRSGNDKIRGNGGDDVIYDSDSYLVGNTIIDPAPDNDIIYGGAGNDYIVSYQGDHNQDRDEIYGEDGNDTILLGGSQTGDLADGGRGFDTFVYAGGGSITPTPVTIIYQPGQFHIVAGGKTTASLMNFEQVVLRTGMGADTLSGSPNDDIIESTGGRDILQGGNGNDQIGLLYRDLKDDQFEDVTLSGGAGRDTLSVSFNLDSNLGFAVNVGARSFGLPNGKTAKISGFEILSAAGGGGDDQFTGGDGADLLSGWGGNDILTGGGGRDDMYGGSGNDILSGGSGNDRLYGDSGNDQLSGGAGNDILDGGLGNDTLAGGGGDDLYYVDDNDTVSDSGGFDTVYADFSFELTTGDGIEKLVVDGNRAIGNELDNIILVNGFNAVVEGRAGNDTIHAGRSNDSVGGGLGNDIINGYAGNDQLAGDEGKDKIYGGDGNDTITGGDGNDILWGDSPLVADPGGKGILKPKQAAGSAFETAISLKNKLFALKDDTDVIESGAIPHLTVTKKHAGGQGDWFRLDIAKDGQTVTFDIDRADYDGAFASTIYIYNSRQAELGNSGFNWPEDSGSEGRQDGQFSFGFVEAGTYYIRVAKNQFTSGDPTGLRYDLHISLGAEGGEDVLDGGAGNDRLIGGSRNDILTGGDGKDTFVFETGDFGTDTITDWQDGLDRIEIARSAGARRFSDLAIVQQGDDVHIATGEGQIILVGIDAADIGKSDFSFV